MKNIISFFFLIMLISIFAISTNGQYATEASGTWDNNETWNGNSPPYTFSNNASILINASHEVIADNELFFNNNGELEIDGSLTINGDVLCRNNLSIKVSETGVFIVHGDIVVKNNVIIELDGDMQVNNLYGHNNNYLYGNGNLHVLGEVDGFNTDGFNGTIFIEPLPVELLHFEATAIYNEVIISWSTASEINNDYFTIESSHDLYNWEVVEHISGAGNSNHILDYKYIDKDVKPGIIYYRLRQADFDGSYEYFSPVAVEVFEHSSFEIIKISNQLNNFNIHLQTSGNKAILLISDIRGVIIDKIEVDAIFEPQVINYYLENTAQTRILIFSLVSHSERSTRKYLCN